MIIHSRWISHRENEEPSTENPSYVGIVQFYCFRNAESGRTLGADWKCSRVQAEAPVVRTCSFLDSCSWARQVRVRLGIGQTQRPCRERGEADWNARENGEFRCIRHVRDGFPCLEGLNGGLSSGVEEKRNRTRYDGTEHPRTSVGVFVGGSARYCTEFDTLRRRKVVCEACEGQKGAIASQGLFFFSFSV